MRTTVDIPDRLLRQARAHAALQGKSLKDLVNEALEMKIAQGTADEGDPLRDSSADGMPGRLTLRSAGRFRIPVIESACPGNHNITPDMLRQAESEEDETRYAGLT